MRVQVILPIFVFILGCAETPVKSSALRAQTRFDLAGKASAEAFVNKNYDRLKVLFPLKEKSHYLGRSWPDETRGESLYQDYLQKTLAEFEKNYPETVSGFLGKVWLRKTGGKETLVFFPPPQISLWTNAYFANRLPEHFPDWNILYVDTSAYLLRDGKRSLSDVNRDLDETVGKILSENEFAVTRVSALTVCLSFLFVRDHLEENRSRYHRLLAYSPMVKNRDQRMPFSPERQFGANGDFLQTDIFHLHSLLLGDSVSLHPVPKGDRLINGGLWREAFGRYDDGVSLPRIHHLVSLVSKDDKVIPLENSRAPEFQKTVLLSSDHLGPFYREAEMKELLEKLREELL